MLKSLLALPLVMLGALPAEARHRHEYRPPEYRVVCDYHGCVVKFKQPKIRVSDHCVWRPWTNKTVCRY